MKYLNSKSYNSNICSTTSSSTGTLWCGWAGSSRTAKIPATWCKIPTRTIKRSNRFPTLSASGNAMQFYHVSVTAAAAFDHCALNIVVSATVVFNLSIITVPSSTTALAWRIASGFSSSCCRWRWIVRSQFTSPAIVWWLRDSHFSTFSA